MTAPHETPPRLLLDDTLVTASFVQPFHASWLPVDPGLEIEVSANLRSGNVRPADVAFLPSAEIAFCQEHHQIVPDIAVVVDGPGAAAMRTPVRPDQVERGPIRLLETNRTTELLARATLFPFYGIEQTRWITDDNDPAAADAQVVIVDDAEALRPVEGGYTEDLCRAWFVLTGVPVVSHCLLAPIAASREQVAPVVATLTALLDAADEHRREWRKPLADALSVPPDRLYDFLAGLRFSLTAADRHALLTLLQRGSRGASFPSTLSPRFLEPSAGTDAG